MSADGQLCLHDLTGGEIVENNSSHKVPFCKFMEHTTVSFDGNKPCGEKGGASSINAIAMNICDEKVAPFMDC